MCVVYVLCCLDRCFKKRDDKVMLKQMDFRIVFFELLLLFLKDKCNYVELNMSLTFTVIFFSF